MRYREKTRKEHFLFSLYDAPNSKVIEILRLRWLQRKCLYSRVPIYVRTSCSVLASAGSDPASTCKRLSIFRLKTIESWIHGEIFRFF
jgi:hypothetical protein